MDFFNCFSRNQHIRNYKKRYSDFKEENHCRPVLSDKDLYLHTLHIYVICVITCLKVIKLKINKKKVRKVMSYCDVITFRTIYFINL